MRKTTTVTLDESGSMQLPPSIRRMFPAGSQFTVTCNNGQILMEQIKSKPPKTREEAMRRFMAVSEKIARELDRRGVTEADIRRTIKRLRAERRAHSGSR